MVWSIESLRFDSRLQGSLWFDKVWCSHIVIFAMRVIIKYIMGSIISNEGCAKRKFCKNNIQY